MLSMEVVRCAVDGGCLNAVDGGCLIADDGCC